MPRGERRPSLYQRITTTSRVTDWVQRRKDTKERKKNRKLIDDYVQKIGKKGGGSLSLDKDGVCCFPYKKFIIVIEVAENRIDLCQFRTTVCPLSGGSNNYNEKEVIRTAMALHNEEQKAIAKKGRDSSLTRLTVPIHIQSPGTAILDVVTDGVHMYWEVPIKGLKFDVMARCLDEFLGMTVDLNKKFVIAKTTPKMPSEPFQPEKQEQKVSTTGSLRGVLKCF